MSKQAIAYLRHILDECRFILNVTSNMTKDQFKIPELEKQISIVLYDQGVAI